MELEVVLEKKHFDGFWIRVHRKSVALANIPGGWKTVGYVVEWQNHETAAIENAPSVFPDQESALLHAEKVIKAKQSG